MPTLAPLLKVDLAAMGIGVAVAEVSLAAVLLEVVVAVASWLAELESVVVAEASELVDVALELDVVDELVLELDVVMVAGSIGLPSSSHSGSMQNQDRSVTASTGTVWPTPAAEMPMSLWPSPYTILVYPGTGVSVMFWVKDTSSTLDHPLNSSMNQEYGYLSSAVPCQLKEL